MKVEIKKLDNFGRGITYVNDKICFVDNALPGEIVDVEVFLEKKRYALGKVVHFYTLADCRIEAKCPYTDVCGGCAFQHMDFDEENKFKLEKVKEILNKFGKVSGDNVLGISYFSDEFYRNKIVLHGEDGQFGFYQEASKRIVDIERCLLMDSRINDVIKNLKNIKVTGKCEVMIRTSNDSSLCMTAITGEVSNFEVLRGVTDTLIINGNLIWGSKRLISEIGEKKYYVSAKSFFQVNKSLTKELYDEVLNVVKEEKPEKVLDLYCGTGTIGIYVSDFCREVIGIESSIEAVFDAQENILLNNCRNVKVLGGKVEDRIGELHDADLVIVDPPRAGLDNKTVLNVLRIDAKMIVYVSCDPITLGRDIELLSSKYEVKYAKVFNMFPRSYHCETVAVLTRRN